MKTVVLILFVVLIEASIGQSGSYASLSGSPGTGPTSAEAPEVNGLQLLFKGQPVDEVVSDKKIKKYVIEVTGTRFVPGSSVVVNSIRAFPFAPGEPPEQPTLTTFVSVTNLEVRFLPDTAPPPGMLSVNVVNPDGVESNALSVDVITKASKLSISSISPESGAVGTQVTLTGNGFTPIPANNLNAIRFTAVGTQDNASANFFEGFYADASANNGTLTFTLPNRVIEPICPGSPFVCDPIAIPPITARQYRVSVINPNGMSNSVLFDVTSK